MYVIKIEFVWIKIHKLSLSTLIEYIGIFAMKISVINNLFSKIFVFNRNSEKTKLIVVASHKHIFVDKISCFKKISVKMINVEAHLLNGKDCWFNFVFCLKYILNQSIISILRRANSFFEILRIIVFIKMRHESVHICISIIFL